MSRPSEEPTPPRAVDHSVVVPAYNAERTIESTVASILGQTFRDFELIVVDDGSSDRTPELVAGSGDSRVQLVRQENSGTAGARNTGIERSTGRFVSFLDNDDLWLPNYLSEMRVALDGSPEAGFAYTDAYALDDETRMLRRETELQSRPGPAADADQKSFHRRLLERNFVMSSTTVRREALKRTGGFDAAVRGTDDYDLWLRIAAAGYTGVRAGERPLLVQRGRADSLSKDDLMMLENLAAVIRRAMRDERLDADLRDVAERHLRRVERDHRRIVSRRVEHRARRLAQRGWRVARRTRPSSSDWLDEPPAEVTAALGDLRRV